MVRATTPPNAGSTQPSIPPDQPPILPFDPKDLSATNKDCLDIVNRMFSTMPATTNEEKQARLDVALFTYEILRRIRPQSKVPTRDQIQIDKITLDGYEHTIQALITRTSPVECIPDYEKHTISFPSGFEVTSKIGKIGSRFKRLFPILISFTIEPAPNGVKITLTPSLPEKANRVIKGLFSVMMNMVSNPIEYTISCDDMLSVLAPLSEWKPEPTGPTPHQ